MKRTRIAPYVIQHAQIRTCFCAALMNKGRRNYRAGTGNQLALCQGMALLMYVGCPCVCGQNSLSMKNNEITASTFTGFGRQFWGGGGGLVVLSVWAILLLRIIIYNAVGMCTFYILEHVSASSSIDVPSQGSVYRSDTFTRNLALPLALLTIQIHQRP